MTLKEAMNNIKPKGKEMSKELKNREWINRGLMAKNDEEKILKGASKVEADRIKLGGTNFALYNLVMSVVTFKDCDTSLDCNRRLYEGLYPYISKMQAENLLMRNLLKDSDDPRMREVFGTNGDVQGLAIETLKKVTEAAKARSKANKYGLKTSELLV